MSLKIPTLDVYLFCIFKKPRYICLPWVVVGALVTVVVVVVVGASVVVVGALVVVVVVVGVVVSVNKN